jgi:hypothetical protein
LRLTVAAHYFDTFERFQRPNQDPTTHVGSFATHVQHEMIAIGKVHITMAVAQE